ncbi:MAG: mechanosensitive ion channel family protein [Tumebacillaceae bacterium]
MNEIKFIQDRRLDVQTWTKFLDNTGTKLIDPDFWMAIGWGLVKIILILALAKITIRVGNTAIEKILSHRAVRMDERRSRTLTTLLTNMMRYAVYFFVALTILSNLGFNVTTLIAGAGVAGLAFGFGAQSLVKDVITGFFIIFEDQFGVGDTVMINTKNEIRGNVEEVGLRITKIRAYTGEMHIIPNSQIQQVTNYSKTNSLAVLDVSVAYEEDLRRVFDVLHEVGKAAHDELEGIVGEPQVLGVQMFAASEVIVRMTVDCRPTENFSVARELRKRIKEAFDAQGIEIPYPKQVNLHVDNKLADAKPQQGASN